jgi:hypothetical protein
MGILHWVSDNWFTLLQSVGIVGSLLLTTVALRDDAKTRRVGNLIRVTESHRQIWSELYRLPELARVSDMTVDLVRKPITPAEELFVGLLVLHLNSSYHAMKDGVFIAPAGLRKDIQRFFSRPMAKIVWEKMKPFQDADFVRFVEVCRAS